MLDNCGIHLMANGDALSNRLTGGHLFVATTRLATWKDKRLNRLFCWDAE
jgi:hypothetical protein